MRVLVLTVFIALLLPRPAIGQEKGCWGIEPTLSVACIEAFNDWVGKEKSWIEWSNDHWNQVVHKRLQSTPGKEDPPTRKQEPDPPHWLDSYCAAEWQETSQLAAETCFTYHTLKEYRWEKNDSPEVKLPKRDPPEKGQTFWSLFLKHWRVDALWIQTETGSHTYGPIGCHLVITTIGRLELFGPAGWILVRMPDARGQMVYTNGSTWGFGIHLGQTKLPLFDRPIDLSITLSKVWVGQLPASVESGNTNTGLNLAGLSIRFK